MEVSLIILATFSFISVILFYIRYKENKNVLLFGKIVSRMLIFFGVISAIVRSDFLNIFHVTSLFVVVVVSDILYDFSVLYIKKIEDDIHTRSIGKYYTLLDKLETPALITDLETGNIIHKNRAFLRDFGYQDAISIFEIDKKFPYVEGKHQAYINGKEHTVINFISRNSTNTMTILIY